MESVCALYRMNGHLMSRLDKFRDQSQETLFHGGKRELRVPFTQETTCMYLNMCDCMHVIWWNISDSTICIELIITNQYFRRHCNVQFTCQILLWLIACPPSAWVQSRVYDRKNKSCSQFFFPPILPISNGQRFSVCPERYFNTSVATWSTHWREQTAWKESYCCPMETHQTDIGKDEWSFMEHEWSMVEYGLSD